MHPRTKAKTKEITKLVLALIANGAMTYAAFGSRKSLGKYEKILGASFDYTTWRIRETVKRLRMQDMIQYNDMDSKSPIVLTEKGLARLTRMKLKDIFKRRKKWDYFWRIILFDIPETEKHLRNRLRNILLVAGLYPFQKSAYVCPFDCEAEIAAFCKMYRMDHNVLFCVTPSLGKKEEEVRAFFFAKKSKAVL